ncbi:MAG: hypothetical protein AVDCRST_MAG55-1795, partial [uncultured Rubrobacteraceae bacterium]
GGRESLGREAGDAAPPGPRRDAGPRCRVRL